MGVGLWYKLIQKGIKGKYFNLIINMYKDIKSKISTSQGTSELFECHKGVRQDENLSPLLFSIFHNDLNDHLETAHVNGVNIKYNLDDAFLFLKLLILLYAGDTVIFSESGEDLQYALSQFGEYCHTWKLTINVSKTKVIIFSKGKSKINTKFYFENEELEIEDHYRYLGIYLAVVARSPKQKSTLQNKGIKPYFLF